MQKILEIYTSFQVFVTMSVFKKKKKILGIFHIFGHKIILHVTLRVSPELILVPYSRLTSEQPCFFGQLL